MNISITTERDVLRRIPAHTFNTSKGIVNRSEFRNGDWLYTTTQDYYSYALNLYHPKKYRDGIHSLVDFYIIRINTGKNQFLNDISGDFQYTTNKLMAFLNDGGNPEDFVAFQQL
jgi:hypothetical protein